MKNHGNLAQKCKCTGPTWGPRLTWTGARLMFLYIYTATQTWWPRLRWTRLDLGLTQNPSILMHCVLLIILMDSSTTWLDLKLKYSIVLCITKFIIIIIKPLSQLCWVDYINFASPFIYPKPNLWRSNTSYLSSFLTTTIHVIFGLPLFPGGLSTWIEIRIINALCYVDIQVWSRPYLDPFPINNRAQNMHIGLTYIFIRYKLRTQMNHISNWT